MVYRYINGTRLDGRIVRIDWDAGFVEGRQYGRGKTGGQVCQIYNNCVQYLLYTYVFNSYRLEMNIEWIMMMVEVGMAKFFNRKELLTQ